ncbi:glycosyltransferase family 4 protein [Synechocystis sp. PCC 7509]|uniref:glycosyltransferase family 4 protein n=1 Tax=Synechocystis sp. PCC 7509 TaxID=927677 RepID=UPI0002ABCFE2|nr:glycosyltransferase family 1 protein [Synechocystis sp. PCC 7509]
MRVAILRRAAGASFSMDVYADGLVAGLKASRPEWEIVEIAPMDDRQQQKNNSWLTGLEKYYERYWRYPLTLKQKKADLFHVIDHSDGHLIYWLKKNHQPIVVTCHDLINLVNPENVTNQARIPAISMAVWKYAVQGLKKADRIIAVSAHTAKDIVQQLDINKEQIAIVPDAVEILFHPLAADKVAFFRSQHHISAETMCLLHVGSNHPRKNVSTILKLLAALKIQGFSIHLWKVGADFTEEQKTFIQTQALETSVSYLGKPNKQTLVEIYNAADVLLSPSHYEGFGMTVIEAMACGTPVIAANVTSLPEVVGDAGVLTEPTDVSAMVAAVERLYQDSNYRQSLREKGLNRAKLFTWEATAKAIATEYEKMIGQIR